MINPLLVLLAVLAVFVLLVGTVIYLGEEDRRDDG